MTNPFLGEIEPFPFNFAPKGWAQCNGQLLPIAQNQALFSLLGTTYGGNGQTSFGLPNLQGAVPIGFNGTYPLGAAGGEANHTLVVNEMPGHIHLVNTNATLNATTQTPSGVVVLGKSNGEDGTTLSIYGQGAAANALASATVGPSGGGQGHPNMAPYLVLNYCIALQGIFPSRN